MTRRPAKFQIGSGRTGLTHLPPNPFRNDPTSGASFAAAVQSIFEGGRARERKIARAIDTVGEFNWAGTAARFFELYDDLFARLRSSPSASPQTAGAAAAELVLHADSSRQI